MIALGLIAIVVVDTAISGFLLARVRGLTDVIQELDQALDTQKRIIEDLSRSVDA
jgi:hypothetical protein